jgi:hypothetical protein
MKKILLCLGTALTLIGAVRGEQPANPPMEENSPGRPRIILPPEQGRRPQRVVVDGHDSAPRWLSRNYKVTIHGSADPANDVVLSGSSREMTAALAERVYRVLLAEQEGRLIVEYQLMLPSGGDGKTSRVETSGAFQAKLGEAFTVLQAGAEQWTIKVEAVPAE